MSDLIGNPKIYLPSVMHKPNTGSAMVHQEVAFELTWKAFFGAYAAYYITSSLNSLVNFGILSLVANAFLLVALALPIYWSRFFAWTTSLWPESIRSEYHAANSYWNQLESTKVSEHKYLIVKDESLAYYKTHKIPMFLFIEAYRFGKVDIKGDLQVALRDYQSWLTWTMTFQYLHFLFTVYVPDTFIHSRGQDTHQVTEHYNLGNDFFGWYLGHRMVYTCGYFEDDESLEISQDQKMSVVANKIGLKKDMTVLDLGCGWGTWAMYITQNFGCKASALSISTEQIAFGKNRAKKNNIEGITWLCRDYRDMPRRPRFDRVTCFEMAEHVGIRRFREFLRLVYDTLKDDGIFYLQIAGLRECWQNEDVVWGLFMDKFIFRGADASLPLNWVTSQLECEGFEVHSVETIGVMYAQTINHWYTNWMENKSKVEETYDQNYFRTWEIFLGWSSIIPEKGCSTCFQIVCHKNLDDFDRKQFYGEGKRAYNDFTVFKNFQ